MRHAGAIVVGVKICQVICLGSMEVTERMFQSPASFSFDQAENSVHTIQAIIVATLGR